MGSGEGGREISGATNAVIAGHPAIHETVGTEKTYKILPTTRFMMDARVEPGHDQIYSRPPSTTKLWLVMPDASSEARYKVIRAQSAG